jgi:hypothetical protein
MSGRLRPIRGAALLGGIGIVCLAIGIATGDLHTVIAKATMICLECIGLG